MAENASATMTVQVDGAHVRVTKWHFGPGEATGFHRHGYDYVVVPVLPGTLTMVDASGNETAAMLQLGESYARSAGVEHDVINKTDAPIAFVEIELKDRQG
ncbi:MAG: cupin domain-containing protein [Devosia sp.]